MEFLQVAHYLRMPVYWQVPEGNSCGGSGYYLHPFYNFGVKEAIVVTQEFHLARALYLARQLGLKAVGVKADRRPYVGMKYMETREFLARNKAFLQLHILRSQPKYLGPAIPITGDGRLTGTRFS